MMWRWCEAPMNWWPLPGINFKNPMWLGSPDVPWILITGPPKLPVELWRSHQTLDKHSTPNELCTIHLAWNRVERIYRHNTHQYPSKGAECIKKLNVNSTQSWSQSWHFKFRIMFPYGFAIKASLLDCIAPRLRHPGLANGQCALLKPIGSSCGLSTEGMPHPPSQI